MRRSGHPRVTFDSGHPGLRPPGALKRAQFRSRRNCVSGKVTKAILPQKASPASQVPSLPRRPQEVRIRQVLMPDVHARDPSRTPLGSTSALPRGSARLRGGKNHHGLTMGGIGPRMARPSGASPLPRAWKSALGIPPLGPRGEGGTRRSRRTLWGQDGFGDFPRKKFSRGAKLGAL